ncbi:MAG: hypothetical protein U1A22_14480 [Xanthomonadaceae bacterium]|nr:hypothetical protein [Xanthomonadaceae bacterium]
MKNVKASTLTAAVLAALVAAPAVLAQSQSDPYGTLPQEPAADACPSLPVMPGWPTPNPLQFKDDDVTIVVTTANTQFAPSNVNDDLPSNLCQTVYEEVYSRRVGPNGTWSAGPPIPNSLPSTPENPYNLHPDPELPEIIDATSPTDDLRTVIRKLESGNFAESDVQFAIDILEGNPIDRAYSGFPLLHYNGVEKISYVVPEFDENGKVIGGNADVHQIWFDGRIMSDSAMVIPDTVLDVPWTITYKVTVLNRGREDFAPFGMFFNGPIMGEDGNIIGDIPKMPGFGIDQTFFPVEDGTTTTFKIGMAPARQYKLTYHWGWRRHPPRIQALENGLANELGVNLVDWERCVFVDPATITAQNPQGAMPTSSQAAKEYAISKIGNLSPAKRLWNMMRAIKANPAAAPGLLANINQAFGDWQNRTRLPTGVARDDNYDVTLFYVNNTLYGDLQGFVDSSQRVTESFQQRGDKTRVKVLNGDYFEKGHMIVDFGGNRGWENIYQNTIKVFGAGPWFTFGRAYWWPTLEAPNGGPQPIPTAVPPEGVAPVTIADCQQRFPASNSPTLLAAKASRTKAGQNPEYLYNLSMTPDAMQNGIERGAQMFTIPTREAMNAQGANNLGLRNFEIDWNHEPNKRLKIYMFDQLHHDVAIWSIH